MVLLSEIVQTFILADFCYYYVKRKQSSQSRRQMDSIALCTVMPLNLDVVKAAAWVNDLRNQIDHTRILNQIDHTRILSTVYRSASALGSRLPSMVSARAKVTAIHG